MVVELASSMLNIFHGWLQQVGPLAGGEGGQPAVTGLHVGPVPARPPPPTLTTLAVTRQDQDVKYGKTKKA